MLHLGVTDARTHKDNKEVTVIIIITFQGDTLDIIDFVALERNWTSIRTLTIMIT